MHFFVFGGGGEGGRSFVKARNNTLVNLFGKGGEEGVVVFISQSKEIPTRGYESLCHQKNSYPTSRYE